jgi:hypothetical protein
MTPWRRAKKTNPLSLGGWWATSVRWLYYPYESLKSQKKRANFERERGATWTSWRGSKPWARTEYAAQHATVFAWSGGGAGCGVKS